MEKVTCSNCHKEISIDELTWKNKSKGIRHPWCRACTREKSKKHYYANKEKYATRNKRTRQLALEYIKKAKDVPCADCGKSYPYYVMDFDHVHGEKTTEINRMRRDRFSLTRIKEEIAKCEIVCSNCHRIRTFQRAVKNGSGNSTR